MGGDSSQQLTMQPAPTAPTLDNSEDAIQKAKQQQLQARGAAATLTSNQGVNASGGASLLAPGSNDTKRLMLGQ